MLAYTDILLDIIHNPKLEDKANWLKEKLSYYFDIYGEILKFSLDEDMDELDIQSFRGFIGMYNTEEYEHKAP